MIIFPAIDIKNKQCVRLKKGDFDQMNQYAIQPLDAALAYQNDGATWLHIIDLDGAQSGDNRNVDVIKEISQKTNLKIQVGGGIRSQSTIIQLLDMGIDRVIVGTYAIDEFKAFERMVKRYPKKIIVSLDSKQGYLTKRGWQDQTAIKTIDFIKRLESMGVEIIVVTDIDKDGMMQGPNYEQIIDINNQTSMNVIASGGVSSLEDVQRLSQINIYGAIIGKALYLNKINLKEAIECLREESFRV